MPFPPNTQVILETYSIDAPEPTWFSADEVCEGALFHSPTPLVLEEVWLTPEPLGDDEADEYVAYLCPTCSANLKVLQALLLATNGAVPWPVRREFGNKLRGLAMKGWERHSQAMANAS